MRVCVCVWVRVLVRVCVFVCFVVVVFLSKYVFMIFNVTCLGTNAVFIKNYNYMYIIQFFNNA